MAVPTFPHRGLQYCGRFTNSGSLAILAAIRRASSRVARLAAVRLPFSVLLDYPGQSHFQHPKLVKYSYNFYMSGGGDRTPVRSCVRCLIEGLDAPDALRSVLARRVIQQFSLFSYEQRLAIEAVDRPHYGYCIFQAARLADLLGIRGSARLNLAAAAAMAC